MAARCARRWPRACAQRRASAALGAYALGLCLAAQAGPTTPAPNPTGPNAASSNRPGSNPPAQAAPTQAAPMQSKPAPAGAMTGAPMSGPPAQGGPVRAGFSQNHPTPAATARAGTAQAATAQSGPPSAPTAGKPAQARPAAGGAAQGGAAASAPGRVPSASADGKAARRDWIGRVVPPYPDGYRSNTGGCVGSGRTAEQICARSIGTIDDAEDRSQLLYAAELVGRAGNEARWKITDVVAYPRLQRGERVSISTCLFDGAGDPGVIAIVDTLVENAAARETFDAVRWAVRLDRSKGRFVEIKAADVACYNEGAEDE